MNMFKPTGAKSIKEYMDVLPPDRREAITFIDAMIKTVAPSLRPHFAYNMLGYGEFPYKNSKKEMMTWPVIALASQKQYISLYVCAVDSGKYVAEMHKKELGNVNVGKSCIRFKKVSDLNLETLKKVIRAAAKKPGLVGVGASAKSSSKAAT